MPTPGQIPGEIEWDCQVQSEFILRLRHKAATETKSKFFNPGKTKWYMTNP